MEISTPLYSIFILLILPAFYGIVYGVVSIVTGLTTFMAAAIGDRSCTVNFTRHVLMIAVGMAYLFIFLFVL